MISVDPRLYAVLNPATGQYDQAAGQCYFGVAGIVSQPMQDDGTLMVTFDMQTQNDELEAYGRTLHHEYYNFSGYREVRALSRELRLPVSIVLLVRRRPRSRQRAPQVS